MSVVKFKIPSKLKLAEFVWDLRNSFSKENLKERNNNPCVFMNLSDELVGKILQSKKLNVSLKKEMVKEIKISADEKEETQEFIGSFGNFWRFNVEEIFFREMEKFFGKKYMKKEYICYPTKKVTGIYLGENEITTMIEYPKGKLSKFEFASIVLAEEIMHLVYWELWKEIYDREIEDFDEIFEIGGNEWSCWHVAEIMPEYLLVENPSFERFNWDKDNRCENYRWIPRLKKALDPLWFESKGVREFVTKAHKRLGINP